MPPAVGEMLSPPRLGGKRMRSYTQQARCHAGTDARCLALFLSIPAGGWDRRLRPKVRGGAHQNDRVRLPRKGAH